MEADLLQRARTKESEFIFLLNGKQEYDMKSIPRPSILR